MYLDHKGLMIEVQCQLMISKGYVRLSNSTLQIFLWLMVL